MLRHLGQVTTGSEIQGPNQQWEEYVSSGELGKPRPGDTLLPGLWLRFSVARQRGVESEACCKSSPCLSLAVRPRVVCASSQPQEAAAAGRNETTASGDGENVHELSPADSAAQSWFSWLQNGTHEHYRPGCSEIQWEQE